jgi:signal transduction histidine kinase
VSVTEVLDAALENLAATRAESGAVVHRGDLPPQVVADPGQLTQLFQNLLANAIRFRGEAAPEITVSAQRDGACWKFSVADNGVGIEERFLERIFVIFQRLHGRERPGTGIGLAICRKIVDRHGGRIWVDSRPGKGSTFHFTLPVSREEERS